MTVGPYVETIRERCSALDPIPTGVTPRLCKLPEIRAVLFDVYGTLMISASGDIGAAIDTRRDLAFAAACQQLGVGVTATSQAAIDLLEARIVERHQDLRRQGIEHPEVDIVEIWRDTLKQCGAPAGEIDIAQFAVEFEVRANPTWPMPGLEAALSACRDRGMVMGIVSNAQFFTPLLFPALLGSSLNELGCAAHLTYFSFEHQQAKPGVHLYRLAQERLATDGILPRQVLYVGNDMLNDVFAARTVGFRTALFAGDQRSLRLRDGDRRVAGVDADLVLTELFQLADCLEPISKPSP